MQVHLAGLRLVTLDPVYGLWERWEWGEVVGYIHRLLLLLHTMLFNVCGYLSVTCHTRPYIRLMGEVGVGWGGVVGYIHRLLLLHTILFNVCGYLSITCHPTYGLWERWEWSGVGWSGTCTDYYYCTRYSMSVGTY